MKKRRLSFWEIWNMSFGFLGIQFGFALQNANVSRIFETLGARVEDIPILWIAAPITGLIVQPIIGHLSDKTWNRFGRRRPYFMIGALFTTLALFFMPNSPSLWIAAGMLWIMDASINISMEPFRAFVGDNLPTEQRTMGFAMQSFFIGTGAVVASALPYILTNWFGVSNIADEGVIPQSVKLSFYIGGIVLLASVLYTVFTSKEYSPEELAAFEEEKERTTGVKMVAKAAVTPSQFLKNGAIWTIIGVAATLLIMFTDLGSQNEQLYIVGGLLLLFGIILIISGLLRGKSDEPTGLVGIMNDLLHMPRTMGQLAVVQFFSWLAFYAMWIYTTPAITQHVYGTTDSTSVLYNQGANWVGVLFAVYNAVSAVTAFLLPLIARQVGRKATHAVALALGGISFISLYFIKDPMMLLIPMIGVGFAWASILSMPYAILTGSLPAAKMGTYMGIFNFFIVIPQILAASILGSITRDLFHGQVILTMVLAGCSLVLGGLSVFFVQDRDDVYRLRK
ncbi:Major facilitator superfamily permease [Proteiniphilum saccharofermentans]|uniref:Major facilitator superfamily permease n=1 Tax=Proteiniphilum saccharofermentans TaxID=1642647 RepID=A0A1R3T2B2_9BACT|nr:MFS transporter [Proteiniphilum saccharofermentans]SCD19318.1 Major facilitator superfamily permease [Proteiniphilum saccharofermentans]